jgi:hypothetical protein
LRGIDAIGSPLKNDGGGSAQPGYFAFMAQPEATGGNVQPGGLPLCRTLGRIKGILLADFNHRTNPRILRKAAPGF